MEGGDPGSTVLRNVHTNSFKKCGIHDEGNWGRGAGGEGLYIGTLCAFCSFFCKPETALKIRIRLEERKEREREQGASWEESLRAYKSDSHPINTAQHF